MKTVEYTVIGLPSFQNNENSRVHCHRPTELPQQCISKDFRLTSCTSAWENMKRHASESKEKEKKRNDGHLKKKRIKEKKKERERNGDGSKAEINAQGKKNLKKRRNEKTVNEYSE